MKIGIIGLGVVGSTIDNAFKIHGHDVIGVDKTNPTEYSIDDILTTECVFICVDTPTINNVCDTSNLESCVSLLSDNNYQNLVIIKSTVVPGTTRSLINKYKNLRLCCIPEFLHQEYALHDFIHNQQVCIVGIDGCDDFNFVKELHSPFSNRALMLDPTEAEITKYFVNNFNALRIVFANAYYELCQSHNVDYQKILNAATTRPAVGNDHYLQCNQNLRGFGGACLPKDLEAMASVFKDLKFPIHLFEAIIHDNKYYLNKET